MRTNVPNHGHYMRPDEVTIAEALKSAGYVTGHFGKWHIGSVQAESPTCPGNAGFDEWLSGLNFFDIDPYLSQNGTYVNPKGQGSVISMDATIDFLKDWLIRKSDDKIRLKLQRGEQLVELEYNPATTSVDEIKNLVSALTPKDNR